MARFGQVEVHSPHTAPDHYANSDRKQEERRELTAGSALPSPTPRGAAHCHAVQRQDIRWLWEIAHSTPCTIVLAALWVFIEQTEVISQVEIKKKKQHDVNYD